jgi:2-polyprenyl-3-methyl-5-hydroxy-6-metoxy-1,4-benzoquinol methylase
MLSELTSSVEYVHLSCPICASEENRTIFSDVNRREGLTISGTLVECQNCFMRFLSNVPDKRYLSDLYHEGSVDPVSLDLDGIKPVSRDFHQEFNLRWVFSKFNALLRRDPHNLPNQFGQGQTILDFGCHDGSKLIHWYKRGWNVAGIDLNRQAIDVAQLRFPDGKFWCGDVLDIPIESRFDCIRADNVFEHLFDPMLYLKHLFSLLKPGGRLFIYVPNGNAFSARLLGRYSSIYWMPFHLNLFTKKTMSFTLKQVGFKHVQCKTYSPSGSWNWSLRQRVLRPGFNRRVPSLLDRSLRLFKYPCYPGEVVAQYLGCGEELVAVATA